MNKLTNPVSSIAKGSVKTGLGLMLGALLLGPQIALAQQQFFDEFQKTYPKTVGTVLDTCDLCHIPNTNYKSRNNYGNDFKGMGFSFPDIEPFDSDRDNYTNIQEINALSFPGDKNSVPTATPAPTPTPTPTPVSTPTPTPTPVPVPTADIKVNGQDGPITITTSGSAAVTVSLNAAALTNSADWWAVLQDANGNWLYFDLSSQGYLSGLLPTYQGALFDLGSFPVYTFTNLPQGLNTFYFGVDLTMDGQVNPNAADLYYDTVAVTVQ